MNIKNFNYDRFMAAVGGTSPEDYTSPISPKSCPPALKQSSGSPNYSSESSESPIYYTSSSSTRRPSLADTVRLNQAQTIEFDTNLKDKGKGKVMKKKPVLLKKKKSLDDLLSPTSLSTPTIPSPLVSSPLAPQPPPPIVPSSSSPSALRQQTNLSNSPVNSKLTDDKIFQCTQCFLAFRRNHDLKRHVKIHLPVRPYVCELCSKGFNRKDALRRHVTSNACKMSKTSNNQKIKTHERRASSADDQINIEDGEYDSNNGGGAGDLPFVPNPLDSNHTIVSNMSSYLPAPAPFVSAELPVSNYESAANLSVFNPGLNSNSSSGLEIDDDRLLNSGILSNERISSYIASLIDRAKLEKEHQNSRHSNLQKHMLQERQQSQRIRKQLQNQQQEQLQRDQRTKNQPRYASPGPNEDPETRQLVSNLEFLISRLAQKRKSHSQILKYLSLPGDGSHELVEQLLDAYNDTVESTNSIPNSVLNNGASQNTNNNKKNSQLTTESDNYFNKKKHRNELAQPSSFDTGFNNVLAQPNFFNTNSASSNDQQTSLALLPNNLYMNGLSNYNEVTLAEVESNINTINSVEALNQHGQKDNNPTINNMNINIKELNEEALSNLVNEATNDLNNNQLGYFQNNLASHPKN